MSSCPVCIMPVEGSHSLTGRERELCQMQRARDRRGKELPSSTALTGASQTPQPATVPQPWRGAAACAAELCKKHCLQGGLAPSAALAVTADTIIHMMVCKSIRVKALHITQGTAMG